MDNDKKRELIAERQKIEDEKQIVGRERLTMLEEFEHKYRDFENQAALFDKQKKDFSELNDKVDKL